MIKRILYGTLAVLVFLASTGFSINMHFCHDHLIDLAVMAPAESCCGEDVTPGHACAMDLTGDNNHCQDRTIAVETDGDYLVTAFQYVFNNPFQFEIPWTDEAEIGSVFAAIIPYTYLPDLKRPPTSEVNLTKIQAFLL